jgi:hypothetical protein
MSESVGRAIIIASVIIAFALLINALTIGIGIIDIQNLNNTEINVNVSDFYVGTMTVDSLVHSHPPNNDRVCAYQNGTLFMCNNYP